MNINSLNYEQLKREYERLQQENIQLINERNDPNSRFGRALENKIINSLLKIVRINSI
jgi:hypothetical protein